MKRKRPSQQTVSPRASSGIFAFAETIELDKPLGSLFGQGTADSCLAACCRMIIHDELGRNEPEIYLRSALRIDSEGAVIEDAPKVLKQFGVKQEYIYRGDLTLAMLQAAGDRGRRIALVKVGSSSIFHAVLVDKITEDYVWLRDPLPENQGIAYKISVEIFLSAWLAKKTNLGRAIIVK